MSATVVILAVLTVLLIAALLIAYFKILQLKRQLEWEDREKQQIISLVSHDIKAPFNRIFALSQLLLIEKSRLSEEQQDYINKILQVISDGLSLIRNLVDYRNLEYRGVEIIPEKIDVSQLIQSMVKNFNSLAQSKGIQLQTDISPAITVISDNQCMSRVLDNLLSNAIKFSAAEKNVLVTAKESSNNHIIIQIKDEASGFTEDDLGKLFKKFQKLSAKPTSGESTTGLGLFIVKSMLQKIGGQIQCVTNEGFGSTFTVTIPRELRVVL